MKLAARWAHVRTAITGRQASTKLSARFAGGMASRLIANWEADLQDANALIRYHLPTMRARSRQLVRDNGEAAGLLLDFESDIVGHVGARLQFRAVRPRGSLVDPLNDRVEVGFGAWAKRGVCVRGVAMSFAAFQRLVIRTVIADGEFLALRIRDPRLTYGYQLQPLDADLLDEDFNRPATPTQTAIIMGVEVDASGTPLVYHFWDRHPTLPGRKRQPVPASDVLHVFKTVRPGQVRGIPWFAPALVTWKLGDRYTEAELYQSMTAAAQGGFFVNRDGTMPMPTLPLGADGKPVPIEMEVVPGMARQLPPGLEFQEWKPTHPTANYVGFMKAVKRIIARAFGRSYASLTGDLSDVNFSSMRIDREREKAQNRVHQHDILVEQVCAPIFRDWVEMASLKGVLGVVRFDADTLASFASWMCVGWAWVDPLKDAAAAQVELGMGVTSPQRIAAERGRDFFEVMDEIAEARAYAELKKVPLESVTLALTVNTSDQVETTNAADDDTNSKARRVLSLRAGVA